MAKPPFTEANPKETHQHFSKEQPLSSALTGPPFSETTAACSDVHEAPNMCLAMGRRGLTKHLLPTRRRQSHAEAEVPQDHPKRKTRQDNNNNTKDGRELK